MGLRITTWNVNGIRNPFKYQPWREKRTFDGMFDTLQADIIVMQELKIQREDITDDMVLVPGWDCFFSLPKHKKGYSGVGIYARQAKCAPIRAEEGLLGTLASPDSSVPYRLRASDECIGGYPSEEQIEILGIDIDEIDLEGRCMVLEFPAFVLFGIYSPANSNGLRDNFRYGFLCALDLRIRNLVAMGKRVIVTGDLNVSSEQIDSAAAEDTIRREGLTIDEYLSTPNRRVFNQLIKGASVVEPRDVGREEPVLWDICRGFHPGRKGMYTHWEQKKMARPGNFGARIDYVLCSLSIQDWFETSNIQEGLMGSDHCPVFATINETVEVNGVDTHLLDLMNPPGVCVNGNFLRKVGHSDMLPQSGRLMPGFHKRRSIKDMFLPKTQISTEPALVTAGMSTNAAPADMRSEKRKLDTMQSPKSRKRAKPSTVLVETSKAQPSMKAFFKPRSTPVEAVSVSQYVSVENSTSASMAQEIPTSSIPSQGQLPASAAPTSKQEEVEESIFDPIASKESWDVLFTKRPAPLCEGHQEPCRHYTTKKSGMNKGRLFWICSRPLGPSGDKEVGTQWRCRTFIWASERT